MEQVTKRREAYQRISRKEHGLRIVMGGGVRSYVVLGFFEPATVFNAWQANTTECYGHFIDCISRLHWGKGRPHEHQAHIDFYESGDAGLVDLSLYAYMIIDAERADLLERGLERYPTGDWFDGMVRVHNTKTPDPLGMLNPYFARIIAQKAVNSQTSDWITIVLHILLRSHNKQQFLLHLIMYIGQPYELAQHCLYCRQQIGRMGWVY
jgi:hypothetical protein